MGPAFGRLAVVDVDMAQWIQALRLMPTGAAFSPLSAMKADDAGVSSFAEGFGTGRIIVRGSVASSGRTLRALKNVCPS
jgi:hypothetical protein